MNCMNHSKPLIPLIKFLNITENDEFTHLMVLVKGTISNHNHRYGMTNIVISNENDEFDGNSLVTNDGHFKTIIKLKPGENYFTFNYCCVSKRIRLYHNLRRNPNYQLRVYYVICQNHDGKFQSTENIPNSVEVACEKIDLMIQMVQCFYAEMLIQNGYKRKTFDFIKCEPFQSKLSIEEARQWSAYELWQYHAKEFVCQEPNGDDHKNYKYIGILSSTLYMNGGKLKGNAAMGIGDVALFGSGTMYSWPSKFDQIMQCFSDKTLVDTTQLLDDSNGRRTFSGCFTTALGGICHEIGHIFDLGHTHDGIMGNDIDYVNRLFIHERFPRNLPSRVKSNCILSQNQNQNQNQANIDRRMTRVKKTNSILLNYHNQRNNDVNLLTENCAVLINNHKWFNHFESINWDIQFENKFKVIYSMLPLIFIEFRTKANGLCQFYHRIDQTKNETKFTIPFDKIGKNYDIIALDQNGNIKKISLD